MTRMRCVDFRTAPAPVDAPIDPAKLIAGEPQPRVDNRYSDPSQQFHCGIWTSRPGKWRVSYAEHEFCHLLAGRVRLTGEDGSVAEFGAGDAFVVPAGFAGTWETLEAARKYYAIFERST
ncbi:MAG TPA: cupin domain-containing protein [Steroidobacteraceae bacterium]|nr:cupin domain-containing protein [Steroidobacteraceae bacterium]